MAEGRDGRLYCRALSVTQPWASLLALGLKSNETRTWSTPYRGLIAIHAPWGFPASSRDLFQETPFRELLLEAKLDEDSVPRRMMLGVALLTGVTLISEADESAIRHLEPNGVHLLGRQADDQVAISRLEAALGHFAAGRFAWHLSQPRVFRRPRIARGSRGLWTWTAPVNIEDLEPELARLIREARP